jgi:hypothetical protein
VPGGSDHGVGAGNSSDPPARFSEIAVSSGLIDVASMVLPPLFVKAVLSPFVIAEVLIRSMWGTALSLLLPLLATLLVGLVLWWRLRVDVTDLRRRSADLGTLKGRVVS